MLTTIFDREGDEFWQPKYYSFGFDTRKVEQKLTSMHMNPVRKGLVERAVNWKKKFSSGAQKTSRVSVCQSTGLIVERWLLPDIKECDGRRVDVQPLAAAQPRFKNRCYPAAA